MQLYSRKIYIWCVYQLYLNFSKTTKEYYHLKGTSQIYQGQISTDQIAKGQNDDQARDTPLIAEKAQNDSNIENQDQNSKVSNSEVAKQPVKSRDTPKTSGAKSKKQKKQQSQSKAVNAQNDHGQPNKQSKSTQSTKQQLNNPKTNGHLSTNARKNESEKKQSKANSAKNQSKAPDTAEENGIQEQSQPDQGNQNRDNNANEQPKIESKGPSNKNSQKEPGLNGGCKGESSQKLADLNPMKAIIMHNLECTHNIQRRRDIKQNYKAKLSLEKLVQEKDKKRQFMIELLQKRVDLVRKINELQSKIGSRQGQQIDFEMHTKYLDHYEDNNQYPAKVQKTEDPKQDQNGEADQSEVQQIRLDDTGTDNQQQNINIFEDQIEKLRLFHEVGKSQEGKTHWDFLVKEMIWMADDFDKETKKKNADAKRLVRATKKQIQEKQQAHDRLIREQKIELKRKSKYMSNIVQLYWKSCEKIIRHNYNVEYEKKRQQIRTKKLESFVSKHLKLSVKVAETLKTKQFIQQSQINKDAQAKLQITNGQEESKGKDTENPEQKHSSNIENDQKQMVSHADSDKHNSAERQLEMTQTFQPMGHTLDSAQVSTKVPFILKGSLREYQIIGLDWMVTLHNRKLNGILADEMGLGKTIQTISLLASLACDKGVWGPHLIVVPTTIIMNWEIEFKKWCPGFKILTYFGTQKERKVKRHGWSKDNSFHICITSYKLVIQDHFAFRRKKWYYMVLDEAQNIKNFKSQRWQTLLRFNTKRRLLLTGTPLQNDVMELWSLMHFLMPQIFSNQQDFKEWFQNPFSQSINQNKSLNLRVVQKLQSILRPFLLRRMKRDVEKQLPEKIEHIVQCNLSRRQRLLYDEYINHDKTRDILADSDFFSIMSILMQLRKVCNHPDLFEARTIESPFILSEDDRINYNFPKFVIKDLDQLNFARNSTLSNLNFRIVDKEQSSQRIAKRQIELIPAQGLSQIFYENRSHLKYDEHFDQSRYMTQRPFQDNLALGRRQHCNQNLLQPANCQGLIETLPNLLPFDEDRFENDNQILDPHYLNSASLPFIQQFFSCQKEKNKQQNEQIETLKSAVEEEDQKLLLVHLARQLALWHSIDRSNRLGILNSIPLYGQDLRDLITVNLVCSDIFDKDNYKYVSSEQYYSQSKTSKHARFFGCDMYRLPCSVFSPTISCRLFNQGDSIEESSESDDPDVIPLMVPSSSQPPKKATFNPVQVKVSCWPTQTDDQIETCNSENKLIKEITSIKLKELLIAKQKKQRQIKLKQPKRVIRRKQIETHSHEEQFLITIDIKALNQSQKEDQSQEIPSNQQDNQLEKADNSEDVTMKQENQHQQQAEKAEQGQEIKLSTQKEPVRESQEKSQEMKVEEGENDKLQEKTEADQIDNHKAEDKVALDSLVDNDQSRVPFQQYEQQINDEASKNQLQNQQKPDQLDNKENTIPIEKNEEMKIDDQKDDGKEQIQADKTMQDDNQIDQNKQKEDQNQNDSIIEKQDQNQHLQQQDKQQEDIQNKPMDQDEQNCLILLECGPKTITKTKHSTKVFEEVITYEQYLSELKEKGESHPEIEELDSDFEEKELDKQIAEATLKQKELKKSTDKKQKGAEDYRTHKGSNLMKSTHNILSVSYKNSMTLKDMIVTPMQRASQMEEIIKNFKVIVPKCVAKPVDFVPTKIYTKHQKSKALETFMHQKLMLHKTVSQSLKYSNILFFPHKNLIQYDCGKLQRLAQLLKNLYNKGSKVIIFTQMTKMLDIFEQFLNLHGYIYVRLDGSVRTDHRQKLVDRFNYNKKIFCFISSTRCGGVGINLTGADCVVFYDTDWNPAMDKQAQDRCHRIGQTKTVHIYRLISVNTIEENIFKKSLQKRELGGLIIEGNFNQEFFQKVSVKDILNLDSRKGQAVDQSKINELLQPKRLDILKHENIQFHGCSTLEGELGLENDIILTRPLDDDAEAEDKMQIEDDPERVDFEANSEDLEQQAREMERQAQVEQYRRRFEEALMKIEDQEDVAAMQNAQREQNDNDDEDICEFATMPDDGTNPNSSIVNANGIDGDEVNRQDQESESAMDPKNKEQAMLNQQMLLQKQREAQAKQQINDGINITQGDIKKHEQIDWHANPNLNLITKRCLDLFKENFSFEAYLDDRAAKDPKFVKLDDDDQQQNDPNGSDNKQEGDQSNSSQFSFSEDDEGGATTTANESKGATNSKKDARKYWDRQAAEEQFEHTRANISAYQINDYQTQVHPV